MRKVDAYVGQTVKAPGPDGEPVYGEIRNLLSTQVVLIDEDGVEFVRFYEELLV